MTTDISIAKYGQHQFNMHIFDMLIGPVLGVRTKEGHV